MAQKNTTTQEGPRDFAVFLSKIKRGAALSELSTELQRVVAMISESAKAHDKKMSGALSFKLNITVDPEGHADVGYDITIKEPKKVRHPALFFVTEGNNLSDEMTEQPELPLHQVAPPKTAEVQEGAPPAVRQV